MIHSYYTDEYLDVEYEYESNKEMITVFVKRTKGFIDASNNYDYMNELEDILLDNGEIIYNRDNLPENYLGIIGSKLHYKHHKFTEEELLSFMRINGFITGVHLGLDDLEAMILSANKRKEPKIIRVRRFIISIKGKRDH